jgi:DNA-binding response OmpR family regulator
VRILVVEDDPKVASFIQSGLTQEGYAVDVLRDGLMAGEQARAVDYDAVVLDLMLPGRSGFEVLRDIRARKASLPVVILTAKDAVDDRIAGLDSGADDYMVKPFALAELSARLRAVLRRGAPREKRAPGRRPRSRHAGPDVRRAGARIDLKAKEYALLEYLMRNSGRPLTER